MSEFNTEWWPVGRPIPYARNARKIPERAVDKVAASIKEFGWRQPIVVDSAGVIVAGHARLLGAKKLGLTEVPVHIAGNLTPAQIKAYRLMDNRSHEETSWNDDLLAMEFADLKGLDFDLTLTGFEPGELPALNHDPGALPPRDERGRWTPDVNLVRCPECGRPMADLPIAKRHGAA